MEKDRYRTVLGCLLMAGIYFQGCDSGVNCRNEKGKEVDWYIIYKLPNSHNDGLSYLYMDESTNGWDLGRENISSPSSTLGNTLKPLLDFYEKKSEGFAYLLYNDQPPDLYVASSSFGHSKGVVMLDRQTGVWLSHSTPRFPRYRKRDFWPGNGNANAQTFMCVTYNYQEFIKIGLQLKYIHAYSFDSEMPKTFPKELQCVAQRSCYPNKPPWSQKQTLTSVGGHRFYSFAKYHRFGDDLYAGLIEKSLHNTLYVKSWGKLRGPLPSNCSILHHVYNVKSVQLPNQKSFPDTRDHSKWCVTRQGGLTCIADMNREKSQMRRGGGAICTNYAAVGEAFFKLINEVEPCPSERTRSGASQKILNSTTLMDMCQYHDAGN